MFSYGFTKPLRLYTSYYLNDDIVDIERPNGICSHNFQDYFYIHQSFLLYIQDLHKQ